MKIVQINHRIKGIGNIQEQAELRRGYGKADSRGKIISLVIIDISTQLRIRVPAFGGRRKT